MVVGGAGDVELGAQPTTSESALDRVTGVGGDHHQHDVAVTGGDAVLGRKEAVRIVPRRGRGRQGYTEMLYCYSCLQKVTMTRNLAHVNTIKVTGILPPIVGVTIPINHH